MFSLDLLPVVTVGRGIHYPAISPQHWSCFKQVYDTRAWQHDNDMSDDPGSSFRLKLSTKNI